jgi:hypothetical protein
MNAVEGTNYPIQKLLDWCFNRGNLREWGSIVGKWAGYDVSGLIGEANDSGNDYAFVMNGFQMAAALAPLPKYDKRYAGAIAKWLLNITNASRLFYWNALPSANQDSHAWASVNDPTACIPYESMKETWQELPLFPPATLSVAVGRPQIFRSTAVQVQDILPLSLKQPMFLKSFR